jgi:anti-sigma-K factor RskA
MADDPHSLVAGYALDALEQDEERAFEEHLALCERCRGDLAGLREAAAALAYSSVGPTPPPELKDRILAQARAERPNVVPIRPRRNWTAPLAAAAAIAAAAAVALGVWGATRSTGSDPLTSVLSQPGARLVPIGAHGSVAVAPSGDAALALAVPRAPQGKTYEAWVIRGGKATPAGLFAGRNGTSVLTVKVPVRSGSAVAVTLERAGGVSQPTKMPVAQTGSIS